jgi:hypothetical protein
MQMACRERLLASCLAVALAEFAKAAGEVTTFPSPIVISAYSWRKVLALRYIYSPFSRADHRPRERASTFTPSVSITGYSGNASPGSRSDNGDWAKLTLSCMPLVLPACFSLVLSLLISRPFHFGSKTALAAQFCDFP